MRASHAILTALGLGALAACGGEAEAEPPAPRPVVTQQALPSASLAQTLYTGRLRNAEVSQLGFEVAGTIASMSVDLGDDFRRGDVLARLDPRLYDLEVERLDANIREARADLIDAERDYDRKAALRGTGAVSGSSIDAALARRDAAQANLNALTASKASAEKERADAVLRADFDGRVVRRLVEPGQTVSGGAGVIEAAAKSDVIEAVFNVSETDLQQFQIGDTFAVNIKAIGAVYEGTVSEIGESGTSALGFPITLDIDTGGKARAGMGAVLSLYREDVPRTDLALTVLPEAAVLSRPDGSYYVVSVADTGTAVFRDVAPERLTDEGWILRSGVSPGERIVTRGAVQLREGQALSVIDAATRRYPE